MAGIDLHLQRYKGAHTFKLKILLLIKIIIEVLFVATDVKK